jgi:hypothetical protein
MVMVVGMPMFVTVVTVVTDGNSNGGSILPLHGTTDQTVKYL